MRTVQWTHTNADALDHHIRILRSVNGGSYLEVADDLAVGASGGSWQAGCFSDGTSTQFRVRLEDSGTDDLACGDAGNDKTTLELSKCGIPI